MAKTTRKIASPATGPKARAVRRKPLAEASTETPAPKAAKAPRKRATAPARAPRKTSSAAASPATADDRPATAPARPAVEPTHGEIAERAYHIYLRRHGWPGNPDHDWIQAIEELRAERRLRS